MAFSKDSKFKDVMNDAAAADALEELIPGCKTDSDIAMAVKFDCTIAEAAAMSQGKISDELLAQIDEKLKAL